MSKRKPSIKTKRASQANKKWTSGWFASSQSLRTNQLRSSVIERLEDRVVMSADPLGIPSMGHHGLGGSIEQEIIESSSAYNPQADFWFDQELLSAEEDLGQRIEQTLYDAHALTGQDEVVSKYGFEGSGQTVVVIDSGIAYEHYALGAGYGEGYRVVGGWDFTENDSDPYDDGTAGGHGTHVAGIIGAQGAGNHSGVATGVDLVGLRVFDDAGNGYFSWVEDALQWVYDNRNAFENEITTVNLSLGTSWNSDSVPAWAMLEDEFAQLEANGIFISVSAGNSYTSYNEQGVSYPAASDHVIPVMSVDNSGSLSYFSQRAEYAIAAPGRGITSTVPDYKGNDSDTIDDDWASMSGTSMAAPYVAGASVLIREAMEFTGLTDIDQWEIYDVMMDSADSFYDSSSDAYYKRLNLEAAIDSIMPDDDYGSSIETAYDLGTIAGSGEASTFSMLSGAITTLTDADYFTFTAGATGTATFTTMAATHALVADWGAWVSGGEAASGWDVDNGYAMDVVAGETYTIALSSADGLGYYDFDIDLEQNFAPIDLGSVNIQETREALSFSGEGWYSFTAGSSGYFTVESLPQSGTAQIAIYDANLNLLDTGDSAGRVDALVNSGDTVYVQVTGESSDLDLRLTNAVSVSGSAVTIAGTTNDDVFAFVAGNTHQAVINGVAYSFAASEVSNINFNGGSGNDSITFLGTSGNETAILSVNQATFQGSGFTAQSYDIESAVAHGNGGTDSVYMLDSAGDDLYRTYDDRVVMSGSGYYNRASGFDYTYGYSTEGRDSAWLYDTAGNDLYRSYSDRVVMSGDGYYNRARGFDSTFAYSTSGNDSAEMYDSAGDDHYRAYHDRVVMDGEGFYNQAFGFGRAYGFSSAGNDSAYMLDSSGDDHYRAYSDRVEMVGDNYYNQARGFGLTYSYSTTGNDSAYLFDSLGNDLYRAYSDRAVMSGAGYYNRATGFGFTYAYATAGNDTALLYDSNGSDLFRSYSDRSIMSGSGFYNRATGFNLAVGYASNTNDSALLVDSSEDDQLVIDGAMASLSYGNAGQARVEGFGSVAAQKLYGGSDTTDISAADYAFSLIGEWD